MAERSPAIPDTGGEERATPGVPGQHPMEVWISHVLRFGVLLAGAIVLSGVVIFVLQGAQPGRPTTLGELAGPEAQPVARSVRAITDGVRAGDPVAIIQLGVLVLILTPIVRVAMTVGLFIAQGDRLFVLFTTVVLGILLAGLIVPAR
jgi:uncharacterized membrane protein